MITLRLHTLLKINSKKNASQYDRLIKKWQWTETNQFQLSKYLILLPRLWLGKAVKGDVI